MIMIMIMNGEQKQKFGCMPPSAILDLVQAKVGPFDPQSTKINQTRSRSDDVSFEIFKMADFMTSLLTL